MLQISLRYFKKLWIKFLVKIDCQCWLLIKNINQRRDNFNARIAAINGFSMFGRDHVYLLDNKGNIDYRTLNKFLEKYNKQNFFIFGFTSFIYENLIKKISNKKIKFKFDKGILLHGGGWKN